MTETQKQRFIDYMLVSGYSEATIERYLQALKFFEAREVNDETVSEFLSLLKSYKPASRIVMLASLKLFLMVNNISINVPLPKIKSIPNMRDYKQIPLETFVMLDYDNIRDKAVVLTLAFQGLRRGELLKLKWSDIDFENDEFKVKRKGGKEQILPLHPEVKKALQELKRSEYNTSEYIFPYSPTTIWSIVKKYTGKYPHYLRGNFAIIVGQKNLPVAQQLLGHKNIQTTMRYVRIGFEQMKEVINELLS